MPKIHPLTAIHPSAQLGRDIVIGPFCVIENETTIGNGCVLESHVVIKSGTTLGPNNHVFDGAVLGGIPQHTRLSERIGELWIGSDNTIRENVTIHRSLEQGSRTCIGNNSFIMANAHVAHDCTLGDHIIIANNTLLAGHITVEDRAYLSGGVGIHQFCRIGQLAMVGGHARLVKDVPPYVTVDGVTCCIVGLNLIGLRRNGFGRDEINQLKSAYRAIYRSGLPWREMLEELRIRFPEGPAAAFYAFFTAGKRGFLQERRTPPRVTLKLRDATMSEPEPILRKRAG